MPDTLTKPVAGSEEYPATSTFFTRRRVIRWVTIVALGIVLVLAIWQEPLYALADV